MNGPGLRKKKLTLGLVMIGVFVVVLIFVFMPLFSDVQGRKQNGLDYLDNLYNSISKGSAYYITELKEANEKFSDKSIDLTIKMADPAEAQRAELLFKAGGAETAIKGSEVKVDGKFGAIMASCLKDADSMFHNKGDELSGRYGGREAKTMLYTWWKSLKELEKGLNRQKAFALAKFVGSVQKRAVEMSYNYYSIEPQKIGDQWRG